SSPPRGPPSRRRPPRSPPDRRTPVAPRPCRTGSPCSRRYGSRRSRTHGEAHECGPHALGESPSPTLQPLHTYIEQRAPLGERAPGPRGGGEFGRCDRTRPERQLATPHHEPEGHAPATDLRSRRPTPGVEPPGPGARPTAPRHRPAD